MEKPQFLDYRVVDWVFIGRFTYSGEQVDLWLSRQGNFVANTHFRAIFEADADEIAREVLGV